MGKQGKLSQTAVENAMRQVIPEIKLVPIGDIKPNKDNPRTISAAKYEKLKRSILEASWMLALRPMIINKDGTVLGGNMRLRAFKELGFTDVFVIAADKLTKKQQREFLIKDNLPYGVWDFEVLANDYDAEELIDWGLDVPEFGKLPDPAGEEDGFQGPGELTTNLKTGDLIEIGPHRLLCGDATNADDMAKLMNGEQADLGFNDPPYGMKKEKDGVANDNLNFDKLLEFNREWIGLQFQHLKENGSWYCWGIDQPLMDIYSFIIRPMIKERAVTFRNLITWAKASGMGQLSDQTRMFATADEKCLFVMKGEESIAQNKDQFPEEWRPLLEYFREERDKMDWSTRDVVKIVGKTSASHYFTESQFQTPPKEYYEKMQQAAAGKAFLRPWEEVSIHHFGDKSKALSFLQEFRNARAYFDNMHDNMNSVWNFARTAQEERKDTGGHATPKPIKLCASAFSVLPVHQEGEYCTTLIGTIWDPIFFRFPK